MEKDFSYMQAKKDDLTLPLVTCGWKLSILFNMFEPAFGYKIELYASIEKIIEIVCHAIRSSWVTPHVQDPILNPTRDFWKVLNNQEISLKDFQTIKKGFKIFPRRP